MFDFSLGETVDAIRETTARFAADTGLTDSPDATIPFTRNGWGSLGNVAASK